MSLSSSIKNSFSLESSTGALDRELDWALELALEPVLGPADVLELDRLPELDWVLEVVVEPDLEPEVLVDVRPFLEPARFVAVLVLGIQIEFIIKKWFTIVERSSVDRDRLPGPDEENYSALLFLPDRRKHRICPGSSLRRRHQP